MKKIFMISISFLLFLFIITPPAYCYNAQRVIIPYAVVSTSWWTGLAIHNESDSTLYVLVTVYDDTGKKIDAECYAVQPEGLRVDLLENFVDDPVGGRVSIHVQTTGGWSDRFSVTMFMGNTKNSQGFGFQTYWSESYILDDMIVCKINP